MLLTLQIESVAATLSDLTEVQINNMTDMSVYSIAPVEFKANNHSAL